MIQARKWLRFGGHIFSRHRATEENALHVANLLFDVNIHCNRVRHSVHTFYNFSIRVHADVWLFRCDSWTRLDWYRHWDGYRHRITVRYLRQDFETIVFEESWET